MADHRSHTAPAARDRADPPWARLLFGDDPWPMLLALLACGIVVYVLMREALPAILAVVLLGLAANDWWITRLEAIADQEENT